MQIMILGMHRSGTSTIARLLNMMGAYFGAEGSMTAPNAENPKGFWERRDVRAINDTLIHAQGKEWDRILGFDPGAIPQSVLGEQRAVAARLVLELDAHRPWVLKEPRFCVTLPFWMPLLETPVFVHVIRDPVQVALSLRTRNAIPASVGVALWEAHILAQFRNAAGKPFVCVRHDAILGDPVRETRRLFKELAALDVRRLDTPSEGEILRFIDPTLFRSRDLREEEERVLLPAQRLVWDACVQGRFDDLATMTLSRESHDVLAEYEPLALRLEEAEASRRLLDKQGRKLAELDSRIGQDGARHRQAMSEVAAGLRDVARVSQDLGATGTSFRELQLRISAQEEQIRRVNELLTKLPQELQLVAASAADQLGESIGAMERRLGDESNLLQGIHRATEAMAGRAAFEILPRLVAIDSELRAWRDAEAGSRDRLDASIVARLASLRQAELGLMALAEKHDAVHRRMVKTLDECGKAAATYRNSLTYRVARLLAWPLRLLRGGGDALDYITISSLRELKRVAPESGLQKGVLEILRSAQPGHGAPTAARKPITSGSQGSVPARRPNDPQHRQHLGDLKVLVLAWDIGHNPVGRAYMLAEALAQRFDVVLAGPQFSRYGSGTWPPVAAGNVPIIALPGCDYPEFFQRLQDLATRIEADVVIACKPRLPSLELGFLMKEALDRPLILDIDDHELAFFGDRPPIPQAELDAHLGDKSINQPYGEVWTRHAETLVNSCDAILVSNPALQRRFGGVLVPHARDFARFNPALYSREEERARLGFAPSDQVVLFLGTVRPHKGVDRVVDAVCAIDDPRVKACVIGEIPDPAYRAKLEASAGNRILILPTQPFADLPRTVVIADLVVLFQDPASAIARYQLPAKVVDALAMGVPVLATPTEPLAPLIAAGAVIATGEGSLQEDIARTLASIGVHRERLAAMREQLGHEFSYEAIAKRLEDLILGCLEAPGRGLPDEARALLARHRAMYPATRAAKLPAPGHGMDLVFFWKQNDTGLYGRRVDMLVEYFSRREDVRSVTVFDAGTDVGSLRRWRDSDALSQHGEVYRRTHAKRWGLMDHGKVRFATFVAAGKGRRHPLRRWPYLTSDADLQFYLDFLGNAGVDPAQAVVFVYPCNRRLPEIVRALKPKLVVCDLVDDHRTWSGLKPEALAMMEDNYREVLSLSDIALANCNAVRDGMAKWHAGIEVVCNACDPPQTGLLGPRPADLEQFTGPLLGYVGNLEDKLDLELLGKLAEHRPDCHILLIGSAHSNPAALELARYTNVHLLGVRPYDQIGAYIRAFNVALIPHLDTDKTRSMNPLKLMVYCSHNIPVVTTQVSNLGELGAFCRRADSPEEFLAAVDSALQQGKSGAMTPELAAAIERNSWSERVARIMEIIEEKLSLATASIRQ